MSDKIRYEDVEPLALKLVPEIRSEYYKSQSDLAPYPTDGWIEELHHIPEGDWRRLGATILFENLLIPFIMSLFEDEARNQRRIQEIMDWIETLAHHEDVNI